MARVLGPMKMASRETANEVFTCADTHSWGAVMYQRLSGERPVLDLGAGRLKLDPVDAGIDRILERAMSHGPNDECRSADMMRSAMLGVRVEPDGNARRADIDAPSRKRRQYRRCGRVAGGRGRRSLGLRNRSRARRNRSWD